RVSARRVLEAWGRRARRGPGEGGGTLKAPLFTVPQILDATGGNLAAGPLDAGFARVVIDSRRVEPGDLFVAIPGDRFDGHDFIAAAVTAGAAGVVAAGNRVGGLSLPPETVLVAVPGTIEALGALAAFHRKRLPVRVVGLTGSNGKTTTKEMMAAVLSQRFRTSRNAGNQNNHIGVPLTLLALDETVEYAVVEMGMNHPGEIAVLAKMAAPDVCCITNVGPGHLEGLGSVEGVAAAKAELLDAAPEAVAVLNADDPRVRRMAGRHPGRVVLFGTDPAAEVRFHSLTHEPDGMAFSLRFPQAEARVKLGMHGRCMAANAACAAAVGYVAGVEPDAIVRGLSLCQPVAGRLFVKALRDNMILVDDAYNANPASMAAAMEMLCGLVTEGRCVLVIGEMAELGVDAASWHREVGRLAAAYQMDALYVTGPHAGEVARGAREAGMDPGSIVKEDKRTLMARLQTELAPGDRILVKGSRVAGMDEVADRLARFFKP
ncbi:MAG: UDP-N-acetylmuramoyl-tripeptide--D-alanyl-D-alanine ligase, partial [Pseudomonadota bacterium]